MECRPAGSPPLIWTQFYSTFPEKYVSRTLREKRQDEFTTIVQRASSVATYEVQFHSLSRYALPLFPSEKERIKQFVKGLNVGLLLSSLQMVSTGKTFQEVVQFVKSVEGVKQDCYARNAEKKARNVVLTVVPFLGLRFPMVTRDAMFSQSYKCQSEVH